MSSDEIPSTVWPPNNVPCVALVSSFTMLRVGIRQLLESSFSIVGEADNEREALTLATHTHPDVFVVVTRTFHHDGLRLVQQLKAKMPRVKSVVLSLEDATVNMMHVAQSGAHGYISQHEDSTALIASINVVFNGGYYFGRALNVAEFAAWLATLDHEHHPSLISLTPREQEILQLVTDGNTSLQISNLLNLSIWNVNIYRNRILQKLGRASRYSLLRHIRKHPMYN